MLNGESRRLRSWKQIARYLDRNVRTVMRWEKTYGMPVHRIPGEKKGRSVFGLTGELDAWMMERDLPEDDSAAPAVFPHARDPRTLAALVLIFLTVVGATFVVSRRIGDEGVAAIPRLKAMKGHIVARGPVDKVAWDYEQPEGRDFTPNGQVQQTLRLPNGDELILFSSNTRDEQRGLSDRGELFAFSPTGELRWRMIREDSYRFASETFSPPWVSRSLMVHDVGGQPTIAWTVHHYTWWPSTLFILNEVGGLEGRFVNSGWINQTAVSKSPGGDRLLAGGISNSRSGAMLAVLDAKAIDGSSPEEPGSEFECQDCPRGTPLRYFVFPQSHVNIASGLPYNETVDIQATSAGISVSVREGPPGSDIAWVYDFSTEFEFRQVTPSDSYWPAHRILELEGKIDHSAESCPQRLSPSVRSWVPDGGWTDVVPSAG
ncbi:MAG: hypothetical protein BMS9Abin29_0054 [Gemmatimonadota bacterium]|nr:MAG: hypothetical protein BMS9Abin29_0054 [Gemmatimonadota bacterium]